MTHARPTISVRRLLVACDCSGAGLAAVEAAATLAARTGAELMGLFVEEDDLLRLAGLPAARAVAYPSASLHRIDLPAMERALRDWAERVRTALEAAARRARVAWSYRVTRGHAASEVLAAAGDADWVVIGRAGHAAPFGKRLGSTARAVAVSALRGVLRVGAGEPPATPCVAAPPGPPAAGGALEPAARLADGDRNRVVVLLLPSPQASAEALEARALAALRGLGSNARIETLSSASPAETVRAAHAEGGGTLVLPTGSDAGPASAVVDRLEEIDMPILLVR